MKILEQTKCFASRTKLKKLTASLALLAVVGIAKADVTNYWANGGFESLPAGTNWANNSCCGIFSFAFPTSGGNPDGYAVITNADANGYFVFVAGNTPQNGDPIPIAPVGLVAGSTYTFVQDMKTFTNGGGFEPGVKIESWGPNGKISDNAGDVRASANSASWETYSFPVTLAAGTTGIKVVPLWGRNATVGYDNIGVIVPPLDLVAEITSPADGSENSSVAFTIEATGTVSPAAITNLSFYDGATLLGSDSTFPYSFTYSNAPIGSRTLTVVAKDNSGTEFTSAGVNITVANINPPPLTYPTDNAPTPIWPAVAVKSLKNSSGTYVDKPGINWYNNFGSGTAGGNYTITNTASVVLGYKNLSYTGVELDPNYSPGGELNVSAATTMHVNLWTTANQFGIKLVSETLGTPGTKAEQEYQISAASGLVTSNNWVSLDIPLSAWTDLNPNLNLSKLIQMLWTDNFGAGVQNGTFYIDNVFFYNSTPIIQSPAVSGTNFTLKVASQTGINYVVLANPALESGTWTGIQTNAGTGGLLTFTVPITPGSPQRFFRIDARNP